MTPPWRSLVFLVWAVTSFAWLFWLGAWILVRVPDAERSPVFLIGTLWAGSFFLYLLNRK